MKMATCKHTFNSGSEEETFDQTCSSCDRKNRSRVAVKYCTECHEYYCSSCVDLHSDFPALRSHTLVTKTEFNLRRLGPTPPTLTERCLIHNSKVIDRFCHDHDVVGCSSCFIIKHRSCKSAYLQDVSADVFKGDGLKKIKTDLNITKTSMANLKKSREKLQTQLENNKIDTLNSITELRIEVNAILDDLEKKVTDKFRSCNSYLGADIEAIDSIVEDIKKSQNQIEASQNRKTEAFICMKIGRGILSDAEKLANELIHSTSKLSATNIKVHPRIRQLLKEMKNIGLLQKKVNGELYQVVGQQQYDVKVSEDLTTCRITGLCLMGDGSCIIADNTNCKLKRLDMSTYKVTCACNLSASPTAVCVINDEEVVVSLQNNSIQFVSVTNNAMVQTQSFKVNTSCWGMVYTDDKLYIADSGTNVFVYNRNGSLLQTISKDASGVNSFQRTRHIALSEDGVSIYVADATKGLVTFGKQGNVVSTLNDRELKGLVGVCVGNGCIFVSGYTSNNVMQIGPEGRKIGEVINSSSGIINPLSLCFDHFNSKLLVTKESYNHITVFDLE